MLNAIFEQDEPVVFDRLPVFGCEGNFSKRNASRYRSGAIMSALEYRQPTVAKVITGRYASGQSRFGLASLMLTKHLEDAGP
jgi:hypothetical protein